MGLNKEILTLPQSPIPPLPPLINIRNKDEILVSTCILISLTNHEHDDVIPASPGVKTYRSQKTKVPKRTKFYPPFDRGEIKIVFSWGLISIFLVGSLQIQLVD